MKFPGPTRQTRTSPWRPHVCFRRQRTLVRAGIRWSSRPILLRRAKRGEAAAVKEGCDACRKRIDARECEKLHEPQAGTASKVNIVNIVILINLLWALSPFSVANRARARGAP